MKHHWATRKIMILNACSFIPSLAFAHGITNQFGGSTCLVTDFVILVFAISTYLLSKRLDLIWSIIFSAINIGVTIVGILASTYTMFEMADPFIKEDSSYSLASKSTGYLAIAVSIHFIVVLSITGWRHFVKPAPRARWPYGD
jgi:hypothetical protein